MSEKNCQKSEKKERKKERVIYLDIIRIFSCFCVIVLHVSSSYWQDTSIQSISWHIFNFYDSMTRWTVPVFVMISGALFCGRDVSIKELLTINEQI